MTATTGANSRSHGLGNVVWLARAIVSLVYFYLLAVEVILGLGFFLLLFGANPSAGFTQWVYRNLERVMAPFRGIFTPIQLGTTAGDVPAIFETSVLFAMIIYGIVAMVLSTLVSWLSNRLRALRMAEQQQQQRVDLGEPIPAAAPAPMSAGSMSAVAVGSRNIPTEPV